MTEPNPESLKKEELSTSLENKYIEREQRIKRLVELFEKGLNDDDIVGYHGTSLESIEYLIKNGVLSGSTGENLGKYDHARQALYFFPVKSQVGDFGKDFFEDHKKAAQGASGYADDIAKTHYFMTKLGYDLADRKKSNMARNLVMDGRATKEGEAAYQFFKKEGVVASSLDSALSEASKRKGVILGLSKKVMSNYAIGYGDQGEQDLHLSTPDGLHYEDLSGLEPIGQQEWDFFVKLKKEIDNS